MRILIITNSLQPVAAEHIGINKSVRGGWVFSSAKQIAAISENKICIASIHEHGNKYIKFESDSIYIIFYQQRTVIIMIMILKNIGKKLIRSLNLILFIFMELNIHYLFLM